MHLLLLIIRVLSLLSTKGGVTTVPVSNVGASASTSTYSNNKNYDSEFWNEVGGRHIYIRIHSEIQSMRAERTARLQSICKRRVFLRLPVLFLKG
jgi:hypothetical protein